MMDLKDKKVVVIGLARTGAAVARRCQALGARVLILEKEAKPANAVEAAGLLSMGIEIRFGAHAPNDLAGANMIIPSPGVPPSNSLLKAAAQEGRTVISEIELAFRLTERPVIAVTGTNGKTTTTTMIGQILRAAGLAADVCGNIGRPMIDAIPEARQKAHLDSQKRITRQTGLSGAFLVVEVSSFQLEYTDAFRPRIGVLLNLVPDHLDWHGDLSAYREAKLKLFRRQTGGDWAVFGAECAALAAGVPAKTMIVGGEGGVFLSRGRLTHDFGGKPVQIMPATDIAVRGGHNLNNAMAATAVALILDVNEEAIARALRAFKGVEHRLEPVLQETGILFYNDSKATNPAAAITALRAFNEEIILLAGGRNKGNSFDELAREASGRVKLAVLFGESADDLAAAMAGRSVPTLKVDSLAEAVSAATARAQAGDVVLLAPACASFDMFKDYEERGRAFKAAVRAEAGSLGKA